jgi:hypothetical protein
VPVNLHLKAFSKKLTQRRSQEIKNLPKTVKDLLSKIWVFLQLCAAVLRDILYGATIYEMARDLKKERGQIEHMFILIVFGDILGIPIMPPYFTLRLLPYVVPHIHAWQVSLLRERDLTDLCDQEIT